MLEAFIDSKLSMKTLKYAEIAKYVSLHDKLISQLVYNITCKVQVASF